jgi:2-keto-4-pentenoate hydratase/2-oxohepta-3-ene-1,7-dioic acid hydratase in catechol pathway
MRFCRFDDNRLGVVEGETVRDVTAATDILPDMRWPLPNGDQFMLNFDKIRPEMERLAKDAPAKPLSEVKLLSPIANPGKIIAAPVNYQLHLDESREDTQINFGSHVKTIDEYGVFLKAPSSMIGAGDAVVADWPDRRIDHEVELAFVVGKQGFRIPEDEAMDYISGYMIGLDMTIRGTEDRSYRKSLDTFTVLGPWVVTADEIANPGNLDFWLTINDEPRQKSNTALLIYGIARLISYASKAYTLYPGDVFLTGTPEGVAPVVPGDRIDTWIEEIGPMRVMVRGS